MAEQRFRPAGNHGREPATFEADSRVANRKNAAVKAVKAAVCETPVDLVFAEPKRPQPVTRQDAVLAPSDVGYLLIDLRHRGWLSFARAIRGEPQRPRTMQANRASVARQVLRNGGADAPPPLTSLFLSAADARRVRYFRKPS